MTSVDDHAFEQRKATLIAKLDDLGDLTVDDIGARTGARRLELLAAVPSEGLEPLATFAYTEIFSRATHGRWSLVRYAYEYREQRGPGRRAYHWHDSAFHAHCVDPDRPQRDHHFRATEIDVFEAHDEFARLYAGGGRVTCADLRPAITPSRE